MENFVYLVTKGQYSDYSVYGVFTDKPLAEEYAAQISDKWDIGVVSRRKILTSSDLIVPFGHRGYYVQMDCDGNSDFVERESVADRSDNSGWPDLKLEKNNDLTNQWVYTGKYTFYVLTDKGEEGALKIANERRIRMIVENQWPVKGKCYESTLDF